MTVSLDHLRQIAVQMLEGSPHARALGIEAVSLDPSEALTKIRFQPELVGDPDTGVIAGGVVTALLDHTMGQAAMASMTVYSSIATLDLRIDYMRPAEPGHDIFCRAHCYKMTRTVAFVRAQAYDRDINDPVATAQAAFMLAANAGRPFGANLSAPRSGDGKGGDAA